MIIAVLRLDEEKRKRPFDEFELISSRWSRSVLLVAYLADENALVVIEEYRRQNAEEGAEKDSNNRRPKKGIMKLTGCGCISITCLCLTSPPCHRITLLHLLWRGWDPFTQWRSGECCVRIRTKTGGHCLSKAVFPDFSNLMNFYDPTHWYKNGQRQQRRGSKRLP